jgi:hypothetical protein
MSEKSISETFVGKVSHNGILIGTVEPSRESKGSWSQLFFYEGKLYNILFSDPVDAWIVLGEEIDESDIAVNTDTPEKTLEKYNDLKNEVKQL